MPTTFTRQQTFAAHLRALPELCVPLTQYTALTFWTQARQSTSNPQRVCTIQQAALPITRSAVTPSASPSMKLPATHTRASQRLTRVRQVAAWNFSARLSLASMALERSRSRGPLVLRLALVRLPLAQSLNVESG